MPVAGRMAVVALVLGTVTAVVGTGRVTFSLVASTTLCWSFVPLLQLLTGLLLVRGSGVERGRALAGYFDTHRFWSAWMLAVAAVLLLAPNPGRIVFYVLVTAAIPLIATAKALTDFRRDVFGDSLRAARRRVAAHQAVTLTLILLYVSVSTALWPRITGLVTD